MERGDTGARQAALGETDSPAVAARSRVASSNPSRSRDALRRAWAPPRSPRTRRNTTRRSSTTPSQMVQCASPTIRCSTTSSSRPASQPPTSTTVGPTARRGRRRGPRHLGIASKGVIRVDHPDPKGARRVWSRTASLGQTRTSVSCRLSIREPPDGGGPRRLARTDATSHRDCRPAGSPSGRTRRQAASQVRDVEVGITAGRVSAGSAWAVISSTCGERRRPWPRGRAGRRRTGADLDHDKPRSRKRDRSGSGRGCQPTRSPGPTGPHHSLGLGAAGSEPSAG